MINILGAGLAGLSCSFHLGHRNCILFERNSYVGGHIYSHQRSGFTWDEGPHVSFTANPYVQELFEESVAGRFLEYEVNVGNYFRGHWIPHPAQSNLWAIPEPLRTTCLDDFLRTRQSGVDQSPDTYADWLTNAFGQTFAENFPAAYTRKYWTCDPQELATDWIGERVYYPDVQTVCQGYREPPNRATHYIKKVRYPERGGYLSFANKLSDGANVRLNYEVSRIDLSQNLITFTNGEQHRYERLISTLPLPDLVRFAVDVPLEIRHAAERLNCSSLLLVNVAARHTALKPYHWLYVYDEDKLSSRISHTELLSAGNAPAGMTGLQVEVYASSYRGLPADRDALAQTVVGELQAMGLIERAETVHTHWIPYANVIFDRPRWEAEQRVLDGLEQYGLERTDDDLSPMTQWNDRPAAPVRRLNLAGRFAQWKYFWTDDCVLRGKSFG